MKVSIVGIGRVGLPLALYFAEKGHEVIGVDNNEELLNRLRIRKMPFLGKEAQQLLNSNLGRRFNVTSDLLYATEKSDYIIISIGTPIDEDFNPVINHIKGIIEKISKKLSKGKIIIIKSTLPPGTMEIINDYIEEISPFKIGEDIFLAYCPERIAEGKFLVEFSEIPQIIGTFDEESFKKTEELFKTLNNKILKTTPKKAELAKLFSNAYRYFQFAIANELMMIAEEYGENIEEIRHLVNEGYKRGGLKSPGLTAGPCLYKDNFFLMTHQPSIDLLLTSSWQINEEIPLYLVKKIREKIDLNNKRVAILGKGFKRDSDDKRSSLAYKVKKIFESNGAKVMMHDPFIESESLQSCIKDAEVIFIATNHSEYDSLDLEEIANLASQGCLVVDIWNTFKKNKIFFEI